MNLALECLERFSLLGFEGLVGRVERTMPQHFLRSTAKLQPSLGAHRAEIEEIAAAMENEADCATWRNPEVYAQIALLAQAVGQGRDPSPVLELLRVQIGMLCLSDARHLTDGPIRLLHVDGSIHVCHNGKINQVDDEVVASISGLAAKILLPHRGLYRDLLGPTLYPDQVLPFDRAELTEKLCKGVHLVEQYSPNIASDLECVIQTVVLIPDLNDSRQWSYNLRLGYFGAIFINGFAVGRHGLAEALIHEYFHQRLWQWWTFEPPGGLLPNSMLVRSPVTNRDKPAGVMLQALLIYISVHQFYADVAAFDDRLTPQEQNWIEERTSKLSAAIPQLSEVLREHVPKKTTVALILDLAMERFAEHTR